MKQYREATDTPLQGKTVLVTRAKAQAHDLVERIEHCGGQAMAIPVIRIEAPQDPAFAEQLDAAIRKLREYDWLVFTSSNGVRYFIDRLRSVLNEQEQRANWQHVKVAAIGKKTAKTLADHSIRIDLIPEQFQSEGLVEAVQNQLQKNMKVLLPQAKIAREVLARTLRENGVIVDEVIVYETQANEAGRLELQSLFQQHRIDAVTFTSSSTVNHLVYLLSDSSHPQRTTPQEWLNQADLFCIGPVTCQTAEQQGLHVSGTATVASMDSLVETMVAFYAHQSGIS